MKAFEPKSSAGFGGMGPLYKMSRVPSNEPITLDICALGLRAESTSKELKPLSVDFLL